MPRWYENLKLDAPVLAGSEASRLLGDVNHAAGNLVHRMYYWTSLLEEEPGAANSGEVVDELKRSLGELHRLVNRAMDLVRPVEARPIPVAAGDLVKSIALRLGVEPPADTACRLGDSVEAQVLVDPVQLDRAVGMLAELLPGEKAGITCGVSAAYAAADAAAGEGGERFDFVASWPACEGPSDSTSHDVAVALAGKLLAIFGWRLSVESGEDGPHASISIPFAPRAAALLAPA